MARTQPESQGVAEDPRFQRAMKLFNSEDWYEAHDAFEELWHETNGLERKILQGLLQVAVAQVHLTRGNKTGAMILYGEGLGRLRGICYQDIGIDVEELCLCVESRLKKLHEEGDPELCDSPFLSVRD